MRNLVQLPLSLPTVIKVELVDTRAVWIQADAAALTAISLVIAGIWALVRFSRGRTFRKRCSIDLNCNVSNLRDKMAIRVDVTLRNCGDSRLTFDTTDTAGVEVSAIGTEDWCTMQDGHCVRWQKEIEAGEGSDWENKVWENKDSAMTEDLLEDCGGRFWPVSLEPGQDIIRSCLFVMPEQWAAARIRCIFALGKEHRPRWIATRVITRPSPDEAMRFPNMTRILRRVDG
jgi:hypothetical protein